MSLGTRIVERASALSRSLGATLDSIGSSLEVTRYTERLVPSTRFVTFNGQTPSAPLTFISPSSSLIGSVTVSPGSSVWYGAVVRGDVNPVSIGSNAHVMDNAVVHVAKIQGDFPTEIGENVIVGEGSLVHAATVGSNVLIGPKCQVLDGAKVGDNTILLAGTVCSPGTTLSPNKMYGGVPCKEVRDLTDEEVKSIAVKCDEVSAMASIHSEECGKSAQEVAQDEAIRTDKLFRDPEYFQPDYSGETKEEEDGVLGGGTPGRIFDNELNSPEGFEDAGGWEGNKKVDGEKAK
mmetsp:Transcript_27607/g.55188  ORF Transcript_27607/g.55188 Transcript_27607/m.55188 type:complete len:292 (+) Transcript_27607:31-906(+)|eukprot:CAMPEP_0182455544 /NCGR_PEP_ID=MMETSP1319-20130603/1678_1 /TAXON_ID=172717 /ORGANISM="Bolidomonas pacifica, Strain RCC208" /LENGTH=291 /DNA_ID=CAMNT_0024653629 /DNA_START=28 /DNA_END=903 /DNA_ORIENTATION=-